MGGCVNGWVNAATVMGNVALQSAPPSSPSLSYAHVSINTGVFTLSHLSRRKPLCLHPPHLLAHGGALWSPWDGKEAAVYPVGLEPDGETQVTWMLGGSCLWEGPQAQP